ncbi:MAG: hypothetical protein GQ531_09480 [Sulfurovum sp.]|nr:hypothetical protein [Sulfurovum sp.]
MSDFQRLKSEGDLKEVILSAFDSDLDIKGAWGYTEAEATHILDTDMPYTQFEHIFASMRAYVEMNMTREETERYGSINLSETHREEIENNQATFHKVTYALTAMKESLYTAFIKEYKEGHGEKGFDLNLHFQKRKEATLHREVTHWFKID